MSSAFVACYKDMKDGAQHSKALLHYFPLFETKPRDRLVHVIIDCASPYLTYSVCVYTGVWRVRATFLWRQQALVPTSSSCSQLMKTGWTCLTLCVSAVVSVRYQHVLSSLQITKPEQPPEPQPLVSWIQFTSLKWLRTFKLLCCNNPNKTKI